MNQDAKLAIAIFVGLMLMGGIGLFFFYAVTSFSH